MPIGIYKRKPLTEEHKRKISKALKGKKPKNFNILHTPEARKKRSKTLKGNKFRLGIKHTKESKRKISLANIGRKHTDETRKKMSKAQIGNKKGRWHKGKKLSEEHKKKLSLAKKGKKFSEAHKRKIGESIKKRYDKIGRKKHKRYIHFCGSKKYKQWRSDVFQRDNWTCQTCNVRGIVLVAHHIKSWAKYPELRYDINNGIALCEECHKLTDNYKGKNISL